MRFLPCLLFLFVYFFLFFWRAKPLLFFRRTSKARFAGPESGVFSIRKRVFSKPSVGSSPVSILA